MLRSMFVTLLIIAATPVWAMQPVKDEETFRSLMDGRTLSIFLYGLSLNVQQDGTITGRAVGRDVTGSWAWKDGYFCREMKWGSREIPFNCQLVSYDGRTTIRFTTDKGAGDRADFRLR